MAYDITTSRSQHSSNGTASNATYSTMVRQLESSPSASRRAHTLQRKAYSGPNSNGNGTRNYSLHLNSIPRNKNSSNFDSSTPSPANSTFDSALPERQSNSGSRSDYSGLSYQAPQQHYHYHPQQQQVSSPKRPSPPEKPFSSSSFSNNNSIITNSRRSSSGSSQNHHQHHPSTPDYQHNKNSPLRQQQFHTQNKVSFDDHQQPREEDSTYQRIGDPSVTSRTVNNLNDNYFSLSEMNDDVDGGGGGGGGDNDSECNSVISRKSATPTERTCDKYGFFLDDSEDEGGGGVGVGITDSKVLTSAEVKALRQREKKWLQMLNNWKYYINFKWEKIRDRCRKGIPHSLRSQAWFYLCGGHIQKRRRPHLYAELLNREVPEETKSDITKDLHRQFPGHELFAEKSGSGQTDLFNVLKAFAAYKPAQGYCQAQGPIAAVLLMHMPAEHAFWSLVALNDYYIGGYFTHNLEEIEIHGRMLAAFLKRFSPNAHSLLKRQNIEPVLYMTEWFMCIYSRNLPWSSVLRVWDMFLCEGVTVLFKVGIYLVDVSLRNENTKTCPSMYETCQKLRSTPKSFLAEEPLLKGLKHIDLKDADLLREHKIQVKKHRKAKGKSV